METKYVIRFDIKQEDFEASISNQGRNLVFQGIMDGKPFRKTVPEEEEESFVSIMEQLIKISIK